MEVYSGTTFTLKNAIRIPGIVYDYETAGTGISFLPT
jgi:hypothetical protein